MANRFSQIFSHSWSFVVLNLTSTLLLLRHWISRKPLSVMKVILVESNLLLGSTAIIQLHVKGCHKIKIFDVGTFPGNASQIDIPVKHSLRTFELTFYGFNQIETRELRVRVA